MKVRWLRMAQRDLENIEQWIAQESPRSAGKVGARIRDAASRLEQHPKPGRIGSAAGTREKLALPFPYVIVYEIREALGEVWILRVYHTAQDRP